MPKLFQEIESILNTYESFFAPASKEGDYGLAIFGKRNSVLLNKGDLIVHDKEFYSADTGFTSPPRNLQYVHLKKMERKFQY
jgi:hypothetical protein